MDEKDRLCGLSGTEWPTAVGQIWDVNRSRFSTVWADLSHHDQVAVCRLLTRKQMDDAVRAYKPVAGADRFPEAMIEGSTEYVGRTA